MDDIPVEITYHRQRSSTGRIRSGKIQLRISSLVSRREQQRHIDELLDKLMGQWEQQERKIRLSLVPFLHELLSCENEEEQIPLLLSTGVEYEGHGKKASVKKPKVEKLGQRLMLLQPIEWLEPDLDALEGALWKFLMKDQIAILEEHLHRLRDGWIEEDFETLRLRQVMSRWGSCDKQRGIIMLSVKLLLVEPKLLDYVCVHELAHLRHADHSDLFWDVVAAKMPDWKVQRKRLRQYE